MNDINGILWRRFKYFLSPQLDIYKHLSPRVADKRVLEVGFGTGLGTLQLASTAKHVTAIEVDRLAVQFASDVFPLHNVSWEWGDITRSPYGDYDDIVCLEVLEHIPYWSEALENIVKMLRGTLYISGPNANASLRKNDKHEREWTAKEFADALSRYFSDVKMMDYTLTDWQDTDTRLSPLLAVCSNG